MFLGDTIDVVTQIEGKAGHIEIVLPAESLDGFDREEAAQHLARQII